MQLFTGPTPGGAFLGLAWIDCICADKRYLVVKHYTSNFACLTDLFAHELGHDWGTVHCRCPTLKMHPSDTYANVFSPATTATILATKDRASWASPEAPSPTATRCSRTRAG